MNVNLSAAGPLAEAFPKRWDVSRFGAIFRESDERNGDYPVGEALSVSEFHGVVPRDVAAGQMTSEDISTYRVVRPGQLAVNVMWLDKSGLGVSRFTGYVSPAYKVFSIAEELSPSFADYSLRSSLFRSVFQRIGRGVRPNAQMVDTVELRSLPFPIPRIAEQRAIVDYLDRETAKIDALIEKQTELVDRLRERRVGVIDRAVCPSEGHVRYLPLKRFICRIEQGVSPDTSSGMDDAETWVLKSGASNRGSFDESQSKPVPAGFAIPPGIEVRVGDLIVSRASGSPSLVGSAAVVKSLSRRVILSDKNFRLIPLGRVSADFLGWALNSSSFREQVLLAISGADGLANNLPGSSLKRIAVHVPKAHSEQLAVVNYLSRETGKIDTLIAKTQQMIELSKERRAALITAAVTGQIDVTGRAA